MPWRLGALRRYEQQGLDACKQQGAISPQQGLASLANAAGTKSRAKSPNNIRVEFLANFIRDSFI